MEMFKFNPLLKSILWGGEKIVPFKHLTSDQKQVGESWEVSGVKDNESVVSDGKYKGWTLNKLVDTLKDRLQKRIKLKHFHFLLLFYVSNVLMTRPAHGLHSYCKVTLYSVDNQRLY